MGSVKESLSAAILAREKLFDERHETSFRVFNGFLEGCPSLSVDLYASSAVLHDYSEAGEAGCVEEAQKTLLEKLPWLRCIIVKRRKAEDSAGRQGRVSYGGPPDLKAKAQGVWFSLGLTLNRDASLYLDTANLRRWAMESLKGKSVLNAFAYTGSLGVAALAGGASRVVQLDRNEAFLNVAKRSCALNGLPIDKADYVAKDFFPAVAHFKRSGQLFDCVFLDPPFFSSTSRGRVDQCGECARLVNKVRPLVSDGGWLVAINNALFLNGGEYMAALEALCSDGYLSIEKLLPVSEDCVGYPSTRVGIPPADPAPFNHATKIAIMRVRRKDKGA